MLEGKKLALYDFDTPIYASACIIQESPLIVEHKLSKRKKEFKNKTEWGNFLRSDKGRGYSADDFNIVQDVRLKEDVSHALYILKWGIDKARKLEWTEDIQLFVGGKGNYRKDLYPEYKGSRPEKPIAFLQCYEYVTKHYKQMTVICDMEEAEDQVSIRSHAAYQHARKLKDREKMDVVVCAIDKDTDQCEGWRYNYQKPELGVWWVDDKTAWRAFCLQCFKGDRTDDIPGLPDLPATVKAQYGIKTKGVGDATAEKLLEGTTTIKEMTQRVIDVWRETYPEEWEKKLNLTAILLRLRKVDGEMFNFVDNARKMGVEV